MIGIVVSRADEASVHVGEHLLAETDWRAVEPGVYRTEGFELREFEERHLHLEGVAEAFENPDCVVFASRHSGETGRLLSAHFTGNFGEAELGGADRDLATPCPTAHKRAIHALADHAPEGWDVAMECTHHGPTSVGAPSMFVELGSSEAQWTDPAGARAVARAILDLGGERERDRRRVVGFGGNHYAPRPTRLLRETGVAFGHVAADWSLDDLGDPGEHEALIESAFETSGASLAVFDGEYPEVERVVEDLGYRVVSETWLRETDGRSIDLIEALEGSMATVEEGLRFGQRTADPGELVIETLDEDLVATLLGIDDEATLTAVDRHAVAYETDENGNRLADTAAFPGETAYRAFVDEALEILADSYDDVTRSGNDVVAERTTFDPAAARAAGVPEGPKFGALAAGEAVTVDGETVRPDQMETTEIREFTV
ncbi:MAG: D-aminoacyl-tRNA deacylase [Halanaeroarchaeum sp.]